MDAMDCTTRDFIQNEDLQKIYQSLLTKRAPLIAEAIFTTQHVMSYIRHLLQLESLSTTMSEQIFLFNNNNNNIEKKVFANLTETAPATVYTASPLNLKRELPHDVVPSPDLSSRTVNLCEGPPEDDSESLVDVWPSVSVSPEDTLTRKPVDLIVGLRELPHLSDCPLDLSCKPNHHTQSSHQSQHAGNEPRLMTADSNSATGLSESNSEPLNGSQSSSPRQYSGEEGKHGLMANVQPVLKKTNRAESSRPSVTSQNRSSPNEAALFECEICGFTATNNKALCGHKKRHSTAYTTKPKDKPYKCFKCLKYCSSYRYGLNRHLAICDGSGKKMLPRRKSTSSKCSYCDFSAESKVLLSEHLRLQHNEASAIKTYHCEECDFKSINKTNYRRHKYGHMLQERPYTCFKCKAFTSDLKWETTLHLLACNGDPNTVPHISHTIYMCHRCPYKTENRCSFEKHELIHMSEKIYSCLKCQFKTSDQRLHEQHSLSCSSGLNSDFKKIVV